VVDVKRIWSICTFDQIAEHLQNAHLIKATTIINTNPNPNLNPNPNPNRNPIPNPIQP